MQRDHPAWGGFANRVMEWGPNPRNGKKSDQAHPPIHPTKMAPSKYTNILGFKIRPVQPDFERIIPCFRSWWQ